MKTVMKDERLLLTQMDCKSILGRNLTEDEMKVLKVAFSNGYDYCIQDSKNYYK